MISDMEKVLQKIADKMGMHFQSAISAEVMAVAITGIYERVAYNYLFWGDQGLDIMDVGENAVNFLIGGVNNLFSNNK